MPLSGTRVIGSMEYSTVLVFPRMQNLPAGSLKARYGVLFAFRCFSYSTDKNGVEDMEWIKLYGEPLLNGSCVAGIQFRRLPE